MVAKVEVPRNRKDRRESCAVSRDKVMRESPILAAVQNMLLCRELSIRHPHVGSKTQGQPAGSRNGTLPALR
jgi:hypothetical protein